MQIISLNAWGGICHARLLPWIAATRPDVLCLQEVIHSPVPAPDWLTYRDGDHVLPQRANLFAEVAAVLPDHVATFCPAAQGELWDNDRALPSQWGLATFVHRRFPVIGQAQGFVHKGWSAHGYGDHPRSRTAHASRLYDPDRDRTLTIAHMHGLRDPRGKIDTPERAAQARRFLQLADLTSAPGELRVLCGDFNVEPGSETLRFLADQRFVELVTTGGFSGTRTSLYLKPGRHADYLLIDRPDAVQSFTVLTAPEVSDHCPLVLDL
ncbi:MAG: endonuclease/exonuclease/phosphatase family protein [Tabrizicola sp.]|jgi:endonuclease/exonuclease/phosphatase family metal-dependent hydrolase|nr:endonuclease/exonuclease/phosphatase family protein [Tabrizicola sp.]